MNIKVSIALIFCLFIGTTNYGQRTISDEVITVTDNMTKDAEQNEAWRQGLNPYSSRPKNALELGIHLGGLHVNGDIPSGNPCAPLGIGLHLRKAINYYFSWRLDGVWGRDKGLDGRRTSVQVLALDNTNLASQLLSAYGEDGIAFRNFNSRNIGANLNLIFNVGNLLFHKPNNKWNYYTGIGAGVMNTKVTMDYFDSNGSAYDWSSVGDPGAPNTSEKRDRIRNILDDNYESEFENDRDVPGFTHDSGKWFPQFSGLIGISRKLSRRFNLSLEHQILAQDYDKLDGHEWRTTTDQTNDSDIIHYSNLRLGINLGDFNNRTEPLYWLNPYEAALTDIAALKRRPQLDLTDTDRDGVIDMLDAEPATQEDCAVDTKGVILDSDGDGCPDCEDPEIYSPPGYDIEDCIAIIPEVETLSQEEIERMMVAHSHPAPNVKTGCGEWFLPMIHYDLNKYNVKPEYYSQLHHVATVLKECPELCVVAHGHTDTRASNEYNQVLSYRRSKAAIDHLVSNYGIDRNRIKLMYGGETNPLAINAAETSHMMNRRVEFRVCKEGDIDMAEPEGNNNQIGSGVKFKGNKNSGY